MTGAFEKIGTAWQCSAIPHHESGTVELWRGGEVKAIAIVITRAHSWATPRSLAMPSERLNGLDAAAALLRVPAFLIVEFCDTICFANTASIPASAGAMVEIDEGSLKEILPC